MKQALLWMCVLALFTACQSRQAEIQVLADESSTETESAQYVVNGGPGSTEIAYKDPEGNVLTGISNVVRVPVQEVCGKEEMVEPEGPPVEPEGPPVEPEGPPVGPVTPEEEEEALYPLEYVAYQNYVFISGTRLPEISYETEVYIERKPPQLDLVKSSDESKLCCDGDLTFRIKFTNVGGDEARDLEIFDVIPDKTEYVEGTASSEPYLSDILVERDSDQNARKITWKIEGPIAPGEGGEVFYKVVCPQKRPRLACYLKFEPEQLNIGQEGKILCGVSNHGAGIAEGVQLVVDLPRGIEYEGKAVPQRVLLTLGMISPKETVTRTLAIKMDEGGRLDEVRGSVKADNWEGCDCEIPQTPTLAIRKDGPANINNREPISYTIAVENTSKTKAPATNCILTDELPVYAQFKEASDGGVFDPEKNTVSWELGILMPGDIASRTVTILPKRSGIYVDKAQVGCAEGIIQRDDATTVVKGIPALHVQDYDTEDPVELGSATTYVIEVRNEGFENASNLVLRNAIPRLTEFVEASGEDNEGNPIDFDRVGDEIVYDPVILESGAKATYRITVRAVGIGDILNITKITYTEFDKEIMVEEPTTPYSDPEKDTDRDE